MIRLLVAPQQFQLEECGERGKLKREGFLVGRDLINEKGQIYCTIYLISDNKKFLKKYPRIDKKTRETIVGKDGKPIEL